MDNTAKIRELLRRGYQALASGDVRTAGECCKHLLAIKPDLVQAHFLVGLIGVQVGDRDTCFRAFASVTKLQPDHSAAWAHLAKMFMTDGQVNRADAALAEAIKGNPQEPVVCDLLGTVYSTMGEFGLAQTWFERANEGQPGHPPYMHNLANNLIFHGRTDDAEQLLGKLLAIEPNSPQAHWALAGVRKAKDDEHVKRMRELVDTASDNPRGQAFYYYGIGKELEDLQVWDEAFDAFHRGAKARRETVEYDETAEIEMFEFIEQNLDQQWLENADAAHASNAPIFVLGQPRTGTTLVDRIISSHSAVHSAGELQQLGLAVRRLSNHKDPKRFSTGFFRDALGVEPKQVGGQYIESTRRMSGDAERFVDKLPQNYLLLPFILKALPNAKIVHLTRDPMDACFSSYKQLFADAYLHSYDLEEMARHHVRYRKLMDTWRERFPRRFFDISYEETVSDLETNARALIDYLELPWEDACLNFHAQKKAVSTASAVQVREPVHTRSVGRWRRYENELQPMLAELKRAGLYKD